MARPERFELPTAWFVVFRLNSRILMYFLSFVRLTLSNKIGLFDLICLYLGLLEAIYWTAETVVSPCHQSDHHMGMPRPLLCLSRVIPSTDQRVIMTRHPHLHISGI